MESEEAASSAISGLNGHEVGGRRMKVERSTGGGRGGGGGDTRRGIPTRGSTTQKLFIGNVADGTTNDQLRGLFEGLCPVAEADVIEGKNFGFVHVDLETNPSSYDGRQKMDQILNQLSGVELNGNQLRVQASTGSGRQGGDRGGQFSRDYNRGGGGGRGRGGRGRGRSAPYPSRGGGGGYGSYNNNGGYNKTGFDNSDYSNDYYGGGPMRGSYNDRQSGYGYGSYPEPLYSRRPAEYQRPSRGGGYGGQSSAGGYEGQYGQSSYGTQSSAGGYAGQPSSGYGYGGHNGASSGLGPAYPPPEPAYHPPEPAYQTYGSYGAAVSTPSYG